MIEVFKDSNSGLPRWLAVTSTAYRDRDGEIVSSEALKKAVAYGDATQERGPLRFWHVPGLDIGTTDFQATTDNGRFLVESGIITNPVMAKALQEKAGNWQMSIGFNHPKNQPDENGVFKDISIFERSITPPNKAANPFTSFSVQGGQKMLTKEKLAALKGLMGDADLKDFLSRITQSDKSAQDAGIAFKENQVNQEQEMHIAALEQRLYEMQQQLFELQQQETALKHFKAGSGPDGFGHSHNPGDPMDYGHPTSPDMQMKANMGAPMMNPYEMKANMGMQMMNPYEMKADNMGMGMGMGAPAPADVSAASDMLLTAEEMTALADAVAERLLGKLEDINMKMSKVDEELKTRGYARTKEVEETTEALEKLVEHAEATQDELDALRAMNEELLTRTEQAEQELTSLKESVGVRTKSADYQNLLNRAEELEKRLKELEGDQPQSTKHRPSQSSHNVVSDTTVKEFRNQNIPSGLNPVEESAFAWLFDGK